MNEHFVNPVFEQIWEDRYCKNGETYDQNLRRVADFCGNTDDEREDFYRVMKAGEFFPGGRTMSNAGIGEKLTLNNCFLAGTKVLTENGYTNIEDVQVGDMVVTEDGSWQPVNEVMCREYAGDIYKLSGLSLYDDIYCTPNHQFLTNHGWVRADRLFVDSTRVNPVDRIKTLRDYVLLDSIEIIKNQKCEVYNLSVENVHSYCVNGVIAHNCFVAPAIQDSMDDIFAKVALGARTHQRGGGIGYDFSELRPAGMKTSNDAVASGPVSFMDVFNAQTATILQGNRRGANMGVISVYHPDIEEFLEAKASDPKRLCHFNLSVMVDDTFMQAAKKGVEITLHWPVYNEHGYIEQFESKWKVRKTVNAKELWEKIVRKAYDNGEPGVLFYDAMNDQNPLYYTERIRCTNPCFTGDMRLLTNDGYRTFRELEGSDVEVVAVNGRITHGKVWKSGHKEVVRVKFSNGKEIRCTPDHVFMLNDGNECCAKDLVGKQVMQFANFKRDVLYVESATHCGTEDVYDFTEPETHWGVVEGVVVHNCAEYLSGTVYGQKLPSSAYGGACNLGSLMIQNFVVDPFGDNSHIDRERLSDVIFTAVRMLDNIIDKNQFPHEIYENYQKTFRTIGLGVTGLADALCMLGLKYNSVEARRFTDNIMNYIAHKAYLASAMLAKEKGAFPGYKKGYLNNEFLMTHVRKYGWDSLYENIQEHGIRNAKILAIAPTGTMSIVFGNNCSSGIEPIFSLGYDRKVKIGAQTDDAEQTVTVEDYAYHLYKEMGIKGKDDVFRTALNISVEDHLAMLGAIAKHVDMSVSKTINIPTDYSFEDTKRVYETAWELGIKGCTIFRPNALRPGIFNAQAKEKSKEASKEMSAIPRGMIEDVPEGLTYRKYKIQSACGSLYLFVGVDEAEGKIYDFFTNTDGVGGCVVSTQANSRLMSAALRGGVPIEYIIEQLLKSGSCPSFQYARGQGKHLAKGKSCASAIAYKLQYLVKELEQDSDEDVELPQQEVIASEPDGDICPECGQKAIVHEGGCMCCKACGYSKCS